MTKDRIQTYFTEQEAAVNPHFILGGHTDDLFCNDALQLTSMEYELHRHLKEQGFEAVFFYNRIRNIYCYDRLSFDIFRGADESQGSKAQEAQERPTTTVNLMEDGPFGGMSWDDAFGTSGSADGAATQETAPSAGEEHPEEQTAQDNPEEIKNYHIRLIAADVVWSMLDHLFSGNRKVALVLSNMNIIDGDEARRLPDSALSTLLELGEHSARNHSIVIYVFRGLSFASLEAQSQSGSIMWDRFMNACIRPILCDAHHGILSQNHVIRIGYPNASEIRNLLLHLYFRQENSLSIHLGDVSRIAKKMADCCAADRITLKDLYHRLIPYIEKNPGVPLTMDNYFLIFNRKNGNSAMEDLNALIGLSEIKRRLAKLYTAVNVLDKKEDKSPAPFSRFTPRQVYNQSHDLNICLLGEPGTGKSEVAKLLGRLYYEAGVLPTSYVEELKPSDILESGIGASGRNMAEAVQRALGGVLFIDEAYGLSRDEAGNAGQEAITQLVGEMTAYKGQFAVVLAGYEKRLRALIEDNAGLTSRFSERNFYRMNPYDWNEIYDILQFMAQKKGCAFAEEDGTMEWLKNFCQNWVGDRGKDWGNAREAENLLSSMRVNYAERISQEQTEEYQVESSPVILLTRADIPESLRVHLKPRSKDLAEALSNMDSLIGLNPAKRFLRNLCATIRWSKQIPAPGNYLFLGPPGTGKTYFAKKMSEILHHIHVIRRKTPVIVNAGDLVSGAEGKITDIVDRARGGMLFIDEAHQLSDTDEGRHIVRDLVPLVENPEIRKDTCFVLAGYQDEMMRLLSLDAGLESRFPEKNRIAFVNYTAEELIAILKLFAEENGYVASEEYLNRSRAALNRYLDYVDNHFGNARYMRSVYLENSIIQHTKRLNREHLPDGQDVEYMVPDEDIVQNVENTSILTEEDIPENMVGFAGPIGGAAPPERDTKTRLEELVGKQKVKEFVNAYLNGAKAPEFFDSAMTPGMHFLIAGPAGSGRHTVAKALSRMLFENGKLNNERPITRSKGDFEAEYVGHTVPKTRRVIEGARGNMLIVDNPSSMLQHNSTENTFGVEALATLAGAMSGNDDVSMVFIDTVEGMDAVVKSVNGLQERTTYFELEDLSPAEMQAIFEMETRYSFCYDDETTNLLQSFFVNWVSDRGGLGEKSTVWGNGSELVHLIEDLKKNWTLHNGEKRVINQIPLRQIAKDMFPEELQKYLVSTTVSHKTALNELDAMTGLAGVKKAIKKIERRLRRADKSCTIPGCYCFVGNPGTGKTTVARQMGGVLKAAGILEQGHVIERNAATFAHNADLFDSSLKLAKNGILFIDEAHQMINTGGGQEVIRRLVTALEDKNILKVTAIILAGYPMEMNQLLAFDSGLKRRFGTESSIIYFEDYSSSELVSILETMARGAKDNPQIGSPCALTLTNQYIEDSRKVFEAICAEMNPSFGNAGFVRNYLNDSLDCMLERLDASEELDYLLTELDIPEHYRKRVLQKSLPATIPVSMLNTESLAESNLTEEKLCSTSNRVTVYLCCYKNGQVFSMGTGFLVSSEGHILTCAHVIRGADEVQARIRCLGVADSWFTCEIMKPVAVDIDMALLKVEGTSFSHVSLRPSHEPIADSEAIFLPGYPFGSRLTRGDHGSLEISHSFGRVISIQQVQGQSIMYMDIKGLSGNSGSPVFSMRDGRVIGIFTGSITSEDDKSLDELNYARPISTFWGRFVDLMEGGES